MNTFSLNIMCDCWSALKMLNFCDNPRSMRMTKKVHMPTCLLYCVLLMIVLIIFNETLSFSQTLKFRQKTEIR